MDRTEKAKQNIIEHLNSLKIDELVCIHNEYCENTNYFDDEIFESDRIDELFSSMTPLEILNMGYYGDYSPSAPYYRLNGYGNIETMYDCDIRGFIDTEDIAEYCIYNGEDFGECEIMDILNELEEEEEDEDEE